MGFFDKIKDLLIGTTSTANNAVDSTQDAALSSEDSIIQDVASAPDNAIDATSSEQSIEISASAAADTTVQDLASTVATSIAGNAADSIDTASEMKSVANSDGA